ncbi:MAG: DUF2953 domain-containing protein [Clostridium sp.]
MKFFFIIAIIALILFFPFKLKIYFSYINSSFSLKIYNFSLFPKKKSNKSKKKLKKSKKKESPNHLSIPNIQQFILNINKRRWKPKFFLEFNTSYCLNDAKNTALMFGGIHTLFPFLFKMLAIFFNISPPNLCINPLFANNFFISLKGKCIITTSIGQIIYTGFILIKEIHKLRRCPE